MVSLINHCLSCSSEYYSNRNFILQTLPHDFNGRTVRRAQLDPLELELQLKIPCITALCTSTVDIKLTHFAAHFKRIYHLPWFFTRTQHSLFPHKSGLQALKDFLHSFGSTISLMFGTLCFTITDATSADQTRRITSALISDAPADTPQDKSTHAQLTFFMSLSKRILLTIPILRNTLQLLQSTFTLHLHLITIILVPNPDPVSSSCLSYVAVFYWCTERIPSNSFLSMLKNGQPI